MTRVGYCFNEAQSKDWGIDVPFKKILLPKVKLQ